MVTIPTGIAINVSDSTKRTTASGFRGVWAALFKQSAAGVPVAGIVPAPGTPLLVTTNTDGMTYDVSAGYAVTTRAGQGAYVVGTRDDVTITVPGGDAQNSRYDRIYIVQPDPELSETGDARIDVVVGTPAATPSLPSLPTGALELARKLVPRGAATTSTGAALSNYAKQTSLNVTVQISDVAGLQAALDAKVGTNAQISWANVGSIPSGVKTLAAGLIGDDNLPTRLQEDASPASGNWDNYKATGWYIGDNLVNSPILGTGDNWYVVQVIGNGDTIVQVGTAATGVYRLAQFIRSMVTTTDTSGTKTTAWSDWAATQTDASRLQNGLAVLQIDKDGHLIQNGVDLDTGTIVKSGYKFIINNRGVVSVSTEKQDGSDLPIYSSNQAVVSPQDGARLLTINPAGEIRSVSGRLTRKVLPFELYSGNVQGGSPTRVGTTAYYAKVTTVTSAAPYMSGTPQVFLTALSADTNELDIRVTTSAISDSSFTITMVRSSNVATGVDWLAVHQVDTTTTDAKY